MQSLKLDRLARFAWTIPTVVAVSLLMVLIATLTYRDTVTTLKGGIALTDARISAARVLQLLTDAETAQRGFLITGKGDYLQAFETAKRDLPSEREQLSRFFTSLGVAGGQTASRLENVSR